MSRSVNLFGFVPPRRYNGRAWTEVQVQEAPAPAGPWLTIDTQQLNPIDPDPTLPMARHVTTDRASLDQGWYRLVFSGGSALSDPSVPVRSQGFESALPPSPDQVRNQSPLLRKKFSPDADPVTLADLRTFVYQATALVQTVTWRLVDPTLGNLAPEGEVSEVVPDGLVPIAFQAVARMAERLVVTTAPAFAEQVATGRRLRGFSAGPYAESYFAPGEFARRGASQGRPPIDPDDALDTALWALMTEDARDYFVWRATGVAPPVGVATTFDYRREHIGYSAGSLGGWPAHGGPDGF